MKKLIMTLMLSIFFGLSLCPTVFLGQGFAQDTVVYYGVYDFPVPPVMVQNLSRYDTINNWIFFPEMTRWIDSNNDGRYEYIAIGIGTNSGYGAQIRYRLFYRANSRDPELGPWHWCVIQQGGNKLYEVFNR